MNEKLETLLKKYDCEMFKMSINPKRSEDYCGVVGLVGLEDQTTSMAHARWMIQEILDSKDWSDRKINRWLGFIQGILWSTKLRGVFELRDESRELYDS